MLDGRLRWRFFFGDGEEAAGMGSAAFGAVRGGIIRRYGSD
jgi:hypothetical protein